MQGVKKYKPKLFTNFYLPDFIPDDNFYKVLKGKIDFNFIYKETKSIYSHTGKPSIDPVVFFKCLLIGYLENLCSDRAIERMLQMRIDLLYFIDHDLEERVPDHSTLCKTRQRISVEIFQKVFDHILGLCVHSGMVKGKIQAIDTAYINANASLDKLVEVKMVDRDFNEYIDEVKANEEPTEEELDTAKKRLEKSQKSLEQFTAYRKDKYSALEGGKEHRKNKRRFMSNATHMSKTDPDAKIAKKSGKPRMLCYSSALAVDTHQNVITHISAESAAKKDSRLLLDVTESTMDRLAQNNLKVKSILADTGFSSGENYYILKQWGLKAFIPIHGTYKEERPGFVYDEIRNRYICRNKKYLKFIGTTDAGGYLKNRYLSRKKDCDQCPFRKDCVDARGIKKIEHTIYREEYEEMIARLKSRSGKKSYALRMQTVEPVFGTLMEHYGLRKINTIGIDAANKVMLMAAGALNLRKWIKNTPFMA